MTQLFNNNATTTLSASLASGTTSMSVGSSSSFTAPTGEDFLVVTLIRASDSAIEVIKVTNITGTTWTIVRAQEGTTALDFAAGDKVELRVTAGFLHGLQFGRLLNVITVSTTPYTYTPTPGTKNCYIIGTGAGGGGGGCDPTAAGELAIGMGGHSGTAAEGFYPVSTVSGKVFVLGIAGGGGSGATAGETGGTSTIDGGAVMSCPGGAGGSPGVNTAATVLFVESDFVVQTASGGNVRNWNSRRQGNGYASTYTKARSMGGIGPYGNDGGLGGVNISGVASSRSGTSGVSGRFVIYEYA